MPLPAERACEVESCSFNLENSSISRTYKRCFLNYVKATAYNPRKTETLEKVEYGLLPLAVREHIARLFLDLGQDNDSKRSFYAAMFSVMAHDTTVILTKFQLDPVPYLQCCACGASEDVTLWYPKSGILPSGFGYCSWNCWQTMPPPLITLIKLLEVDFLDLLNNLPFTQGQKSRLTFVHHVTRWVFGDLLLN